MSQAAPDTSAQPDLGQPPLESLFYVKNLDSERMGALQWVLLALWIPVGFPLMFLRAAATILASVIVPPAWRSWWICTLGGMFTVVKGKTRMRDHGMVVVSNHISYFDRMTVAAAVRSRVPLATLIWHKVNWLNAMMARPTIPVYEPGRNRKIVQRVKTYLEHGNVLLFPEATVTDGTALLRFEKMAFSLDSGVVLVTVRYRGALPFLRPSALRERLIIQVFYSLFQPWTVAHLEVLGLYRRDPDETPDAFAARAQRIIADALDIPATNYTWRDRRKLLKQHGHDLAERKKAREARKKR